MRSSARLVGGMPPSQVSRGPLQWLSPRSLRTRLVAVVLAMNCLAAVLLGVIIVWQARISTKLEINSSLQLADGLAANAVQLMQDAPASVPVPLQLRDIQLHFQSLRHVQIAVRDKSGKQLDDPPAAAAASQPRAVELMEHSPSWFRSLIAPAVESRVFPVVVRGEWLGNVTVTTEPGDEVDEAWDYAYSILASYLLVSSSMLGALFLLFGRVLAPLTHLGLGLKKLVGKNYTVRLPPPALLELDEITYHFNTAAQALALAQQANQDLNRRLLTAHDDERRRTALELHDEAGPCLFALEATAASMSNVKDGTAALAQLRERAHEVVQLVRQVQGINRRVLDRLRPMALGRIPLRDSIIKLIVYFDTGSLIEHAIGNIKPSYGYLVDLTFYRCTQEGLFNAIRHAHANHIGLTLRETEHGSRPCLTLTIQDDGKGIERQHREGIGLLGMRERVEALSGSFDIQSSAAGTMLCIILPIDTAAVQAARNAEAALP